MRAGAVDLVVCATDGALALWTHTALHGTAALTDRVQVPALVLVKRALLQPQCSDDLLH